MHNMGKGTCKEPGFTSEIIPLAARGMLNKSSLCYQESSRLVHEGGNPAATWVLSTAHWEKQSGLCAQQEGPSVSSLLNFQLAWPEPT